MLDFLSDYHYRGFYLLLCINIQEKPVLSTVGSRDGPYDSYSTSSGRDSMVSPMLSCSPILTHI